MSGENSGSALTVERRGYEDFDVRTQGCALGFAQSAMIGSKLYVDGGVMWYKNGTTSPEGPNMWLRVLDTSKSFIVDDLDQIPITFLERPEEVPEISGGDLWAYEDRLYLRPGYSETADVNWPGFNRLPNGTVVDFWRYDPNSDSWDVFQHNPETVTGEIVPRLGHPVSVSINSLKKAYVISGEDNVNGGFFNGMLVYDFEKESWQQRTTPWANWASGLAVHVPIGEAGYILAFAGRSREENQLERVEIYDLESNVWRTTQFATAGEDRLGLPGDRQKPCAVMAQAKDGSSFNIYVFGGIDLAGSVPFTDVWVLSIPSFRWILVNKGTSNAPQGLESMSCNIVGGGRKMMVYGGRHTPGNRGATCEPGGTHVFDLTTLKWQDTYDPDGDEYEVPSVIYDIIGGDAYGGATLLPEPGFANEEMEEKVNTMLSEIRASQDNSTTTTTTTSSSSTGTTTDSSTSSSSSSSDTLSSGSSTGGNGISTGAIVGIVVGAIFGLALIALAIWFFRFRRRKTFGENAMYAAEMSTDPNREFPPETFPRAPPQELASDVPLEMPTPVPQNNYPSSNMSYYEPKIPESTTEFQASPGEAYYQKPQDQVSPGEAYYQTPQDQASPGEAYYQIPQDQHYVDTQHNVNDSQLQSQHEQSISDGYQDNRRYYG